MLKRKKAPLFLPSQTLLSKTHTTGESVVMEATPWKQEGASVLCRLFSDSHAAVLDGEKGGHLPGNSLNPSSTQPRSLDSELLHKPLQNP